MNWTEILFGMALGAVEAALIMWCLARRIASNERSRIINHGYNFQRRQSKISPTLNDFLNGIENREHRKS